MWETPLEKIKSARFPYLTGFALGGRSVVLVDENAARCWDAWSSAEQARLDCPWGTFTAAALTPDGHTLVTGGSDGTVVVWDLHSLLQCDRTTPRKLTALEQQMCWDALAGESAAAYARMAELRADPWGPWAS
jgi:WD40 repeat protein